jgi:hypothetical protein
MSLEATDGGRLQNKRCIFSPGKFKVRQITEFEISM